MKRFTLGAAVVGTVVFAVLLWRLDLPRVGALLVAAGWGIALIVGQEAVAHVLNALGWRWASDPRQAAAVPLRRLVVLRVAGDAINYLTPSGTLAGEVGRTAMLKASHATGHEAASVIVAKVAQTLGQALFVAVGVVVCVRARLGFVAPPVWAVAVGLITVALGGALAIVLGRRGFATWRPPRIRPPLAAFVRRHGGRFATATLLFAAAYAWGAVEAYLICRSLGLRLSGSAILAIETLSAAVDGVLFMVPAKIGVQEGGKTAIFAALGLAPSAGFAFGLLRHLRELVWAAGGLVICLVAWRPAPAAAGGVRRDVWDRESGAVS